MRGGVSEWVTALANGEATSATVTGLAPGEYRIRVRATNPHGGSRWVRDRGHRRRRRLMRPGHCATWRHSGRRRASAEATSSASVTATDPDAGDSVAFALNGGADEAAFAITPAGVLTFLTAPDHERPADSGGDNGYHVVARASDGSLTADQAVTVR